MSGNQFNRVTIIDLEATCWEKPNPKRRSEIIEIGCALIEVQTAKIIDNRSIYVLPKLKNSLPLSKFCRDLTGITTGQLRKQGKPLKEAIAELKNHYPTSKTWMSWGAYDLRMLKQDCEHKKVDFPFRDGYHVNAKNLFGLLRRDKGRSIGMPMALKLLDMHMTGQHHSGKDDALNIARIVGRMLWDIPFMLCPNDIRKLEDETIIQSEAGSEQKPAT